MTRLLQLVFKIVLLFGLQAHTFATEGRSRRSTESGCIPPTTNSTLETLCESQAEILEELFTDALEITYEDKEAPMSGAEKHLNDVTITFFYSWKKKDIQGPQAYEKIIRPVLKDVHNIQRDNLITTNIPGKSIKGKFTLVAGNTRNDVGFEIFFRSKKIIRAIIAMADILAISARCTDDSKDFICEQQFFKIKDIVQGMNRFESVGEQSILYKVLKNTKITVVEEGQPKGYRGFKEFETDFKKLVKKHGIKKIEFINEQQHQNSPGSLDIRMLVHTAIKNKKYRYRFPFIAEFKKGTEEIESLEVRLPYKK